MYVGDMVQGKNTTYSYKIKQCRAIEKENWIVVEGTHEPIIDKETFNLAQALFKKNIRKSPKKDTVDLFSGLVRCADCKRIMNKKTNNHPYGTYRYYRCVTATKMKKSSCKNHTIRIDKLEEIVLLTIQKMIDSAINMSDILERINNSSRRKNSLNTLENSIKSYIKKRENLHKTIADLYLDWKSGIISKNEYLILKERLYEKLDILEKNIENSNKLADQFNKGVYKENDFITHFKKYGNIKALTRPLLTELVEEILVYEGGNIEVVFRFKDAYLQALEYIEVNKELLSEKKVKNKSKSA